MSNRPKPVVDSVEKAIALQWRQPMSGSAGESYRRLTKTEIDRLRLAMSEGFYRCAVKGVDRAHVAFMAIEETNNRPDVSIDGRGKKRAVVRMDCVGWTSVSSDDLAASEWLRSRAETIMREFAISPGRSWGGMYTQFKTEPEVADAAARALARLAREAATR